MFALLTLSASLTLSFCGTHKWPSDFCQNQNIAKMTLFLVCKVFLRGGIGTLSPVWKYRPLNSFEIMKASKFSTDWYFSCRKKLFQLLTSNGFTHLRSIARCHKNDLYFSTKAFYNLRPIHRTTLIR